MVQVTNATEAPLKQLAQNWKQKQRQDFTLALKREERRIVDEYPDMTQRQLLDIIEQRTTCIISQSTLSRIVKGKARWLTTSLTHRRRIRAGQHDQLEVALVAWAHHWLDNNGVLT